MNEYILGGLVGSLQVLVGYPLDTLKTNIQTKKKAARYAAPRYVLSRMFLNGCFFSIKLYNKSTEK